MSAARQTPWLNNLRKKIYKSAETRLEDEIWAYVDYMAPTPEEEIVVTYVGNHVQNVLSPVFPDCNIHTSGSTSTGLRLPHSDIDLVVETAEEISSTDGLVELADLVRGEYWAEHVDEILDARVPIIKISTTREFGSLNFDVGINNTSGLINNEWVKRRLRTMPALKPLILIIRGALSQRGLNDASQHGLSSFAVVCMCVFFLQRNPYQMPKSQLADPKGKKSMSAILQGFLLYYSRDIPFVESYISVSRGKLVKKPKRGKGILIHRRCHDNLVIQCPNDFARNITASLSLEKFTEIRRVFRVALEKIRDAEKTNRNVLGPLVSVDQMFVARRRQIRYLVRSGELLENLLLQEAEPEEDLYQEEDLDQGEELVWGNETETPSMWTGYAMADPVPYGASFHYPQHHQMGLLEHHPYHPSQNWNGGWNPYIGTANQWFGNERG